MEYALLNKEETTLSLQLAWKEIDFPSHSKDWKKFEPNNKSIAFNILYVSHNAKEIRHTYKSKHTLQREN